MNTLTGYERLRQYSNVSGGTVLLSEGATAEEIAQAVQQAAASGASVVVLHCSEITHEHVIIPDAAELERMAAWAAEAKEEELKAECERLYRQKFPRPANTKPRPAQCAPRLARVVVDTATAEKPRPPPSS